MCFQFLFSFFLLNRKSSLFEGIGSHPGQMRTGDENEKTPHYPVPNNSCIYIFISLSVHLILCFLSTCLHSYKWPHVFGVPRTSHSSHLHLNSASAPITCWRGFQKCKLRSSVTISGETAHLFSLMYFLDTVQIWVWLETQCVGSLKSVLGNGITNSEFYS